MILHSTIVLFLPANGLYLAQARNQIDHNTVLHALVIAICLVAVGDLHFHVKWRLSLT